MAARKGERMKVMRVRPECASHPPFNQSFGTHRSQAGMSASKRPTASSQTDTSSTREQQAGAGPADAQRMFDTWMNAWRAFADKMPQPGPGAAMNGAAVPFPFMMPPMPAAAPMGGMPGIPAGAAQAFDSLKLPVASVPPQRLQQLQAD